MAGSIPQSFIDDLIERVDIVDVIDSRVKLKKAGKNYSACCPFHDEKTPSFTVSPDKQFFYCFGCGASGNSVGFVMDYERLSFPEAIESLAKVAGVEVPREVNKDPKKRAYDEAQEQARKTLYSLMEKSNEFYQQQLREHPSKQTPIHYLKNRGLSGQIAKDFGIGYAPSGWDNLTKALATSNQYQDLLLQGGMLIHNEEKDRLYDRFRERIMFPIRDSRGRVIGFGGRVLGDEKPKYLNSPETPIFHKGKELYGLYEARQAYRQLPRLLVVEGYMDVVALAQYDIRYGVATLGTACGEEHLTRAFKYTNEVVFCFDGDEAGRKAARRAMENALPAMEDGRQIKFLYLPEGEDPDTLVRQLGKDKFTHLIESASPLENFLFDELGQHFNTQTMEGRARLCKIAAPMLNELPRGVYRELMFNQLANRTQLSMDALMNLLNELPEAGFEQIDSAPISSNTHTHTETQPNNINPVDIRANTTTLSEHPNSHYATLNHSADYTKKEARSDIVHSHRTLKNSADSNRSATFALSLLLFQPNIAKDISEENIEELGHSSQDHVKLLSQLIALLKQRPEFSSGQILGHWQGTYGAQATESLKSFIDKASLFRHAQNLTEDDEKHAFDAQKEFHDSIDFLVKRQQEEECDKLIDRLNKKAPNEWSESEKQLYRKAINARAK